MYYAIITIISQEVMNRQPKRIDVLNLANDATNRGLNQHSSIIRAIFGSSPSLRTYFPQARCDFN